MGLRTHKAGSGPAFSHHFCVTEHEPLTSLSLPFPTDTMMGLTLMARAQRALGRIESNMVSGQGARLVPRSWALCGEGFQSYTSVQEDAMIQ